jgi:hypothetical protein
MLTIASVNWTRVTLQAPDTLIAFPFKSDDPFVLSGVGGDVPFRLKLSCRPILAIVVLVYSPPLLLALLLKSPPPI